MYCCPLDNKNKIDTIKKVAMMVNAFGRLSTTETCCDVYLFVRPYFEVTNPVDNVLITAILDHYTIIMDILWETQALNMLHALQWIYWIRTQTITIFYTKQ